MANALAADPPTVIAGKLSQSQSSSAQSTQSALGDFTLAPPLLTRIETLNGKPLGLVLSVFQSSDGFMWFGTINGLVRYDGYEAKAYRHVHDDPNSLSGNMVVDIVEDKNQHLWVSTWSNGLNKFDPATETFEHFTPDFAGDGSTSGMSVVALHTPDILAVSKGSQLALLHMNKEHMNKEHMNKEHMNKGDMNEQRWQTIDLPNTADSTVIYTTVTDSKGKLWIATTGSGLYQYDPDTKTIIQFKHDPDDPNTLSSNNIYALIEDDAGELWIGTEFGPNKFNPQSGTINRKVIAQLADVEVDWMFKDGNGHIWIAEDDKYITRYVPQLDAATTIELGSSVTIMSIYADRNGLIWLGTRNGVIKLNPQAMTFKLLQLSNESAMSIKSIVIDDDQRVWLGSENDLYRLDERDLGVIKQVEGLSAWRLAHHDNALISIGSYYQDGMSKVDTKSKEVELFESTTAADDSRVAYIESTLYDGEYVWFTLSITQSIRQTGLYRSRIIQGDDSYETEQVVANVNAYDVIKLSPSTLLMATTEGLIRYNIADNQSAFVKPDANDRHGAVCLYRDAQQRIWLCVPGFGLGLFNPQDDSVTIYPWTDDVIRSIAQDDLGNLWLSGNSRLLRFSPSQQTFKIFDESNGVPTSTFHYKSATKTPTGALLFGTADGLIYFHPQKVMDDQPGAATTITDFKVLNQSIKPTKAGEGGLLTQLAPYTDEISLTYQDYLFSFTFASLDYLAPEKLQYAYKMEGLDKDWLYTDASNRTATYTTLAPGKYTFKVKGTNNKGQWNEGSAIEVNILPPIWATMGAYVFYILSLILLILLFNYTRTKQLRLRAQSLEKGIEERTIELQQRADTITGLLEDKDQLLADKDQLFANISHEFRTPLTLILGPLENELKNSNNDSHNEKTRNMLSLAKVNGQRLLNMVDQLLDIAQHQGSVQPSTEPKNVVAVCEFLLASYRSLAELRQVTLTLDNQLDEDIFVAMQPDALEKILSNLLTNAFKYSGDRQKITLRMMLSTPESVQVSVCDSGQGISEADQKHIFDRFTRLDNAKGYVPGAGIGLALVKDLVIQHQGSITVASQLEVGSTFTVTLPVLADCNNDCGEKADIVNEALVLSAVDQVIQHRLPDVQPLYHGTPEIDASRANVLVVEDNLDMQQFIVSCLSDNFHCSVAPDGEAGVQLARETLPDLIISDVMMPKMDGFTLTRVLKNDEMTSHIPLILLTAHGDKESRLKGWSERADEFLQKPFNTDELLLRVDNLLAIRSLLRQRYQREFSAPQLATGLPAVAQAAKVAEFEKVATVAKVIKTEQPPQSKDAEQPVNLTHQAFFAQVNEILEKHYNEEDFGVPLFAEQMALSTRQLARKMKALLDLTPVESIRNFRLKKAAEQLAAGTAPSEVYHSVGFSSHSYFSQCFKAQYQCLPSDYLK